MNTTKARIASVQIGNLEVEGLMLPDGSFGIAVSQIADLFQTHKNYTSQHLKRLLGEEFRPHKISTELGNSKRNVISLLELEKVIFELVLKGNQQAIEFARIMVGLSLTQLWSDAFGIKFNSEERQQYVKFREVHKQQFHPKFTSWLKVDGCTGKDYAKAVQMLKAYGGLPYYSVNQYDSDELQLLNEVEQTYHAYRKIGMTHIESLQAI